MIKEALTLASKALASNFITLKSPYKLTFALTYRCNSRCRTCGIWKRKSGSELSTEEVKEFFSKNVFPWVNLTGGEVFLRKDLVDIAKSMKGTYLLNITTNGILTEKILSDCKELEKSVPRFILTVSVDGPRELHDKVRGVKCWDKASNTFARARKMGLETYIGYTISPYNTGKLSETFEELKKPVPGLKMSDFHVNFYHESEVYFNNKGCAPGGYRKKFGEEIEEFMKAKKGLGPVSFLERSYLKNVDSYLKSGISPLPCKALSSSCYMDPEGNVYPCTIFNKKLGNIRNAGYDLKKIWNSEKSDETRKLVEKNKCPGCWTPCEAYQTILGNLLRR